MSYDSDVIIFLQYHLTNITCKLYYRVGILLYRRMEHEQTTTCAYHLIFPC